MKKKFDDHDYQRYAKLKSKVLLKYEDITKQNKVRPIGIMGIVEKEKDGKRSEIDATANKNNAERQQISSRRNQRD